MGDTSSARPARVAGKGLGVVATRDIAPFTFVAEYPGHRMSRRQFDLRAAAGKTTGRYAVAHYSVDSRGRLDLDHVVDPGISRGRLSARHAGRLGPRINEPGCGHRGGAPNLVWVWNVPDYRVELWTGPRRVAKGAELTACYGTSGGYRRTYCTPCTDSAVEPPLHVILRAGDRPAPLGDVGGEPALRRAASLGAARGVRPAQVL